jgi:hypothetical protein
MIKVLNIPHDNMDILDLLQHPATQVFYEAEADGGAILKKAADEIERLRKENAEIKRCFPRFFET